MSLYTNKEKGFWVANPPQKHKLDEKTRFGWKKPSKTKPVGVKADFNTPWHDLTFWVLKMEVWFLQDFSFNLGYV